MSRLVAIDWMRGIVMILMTIDHASQFWNKGRVAIDSAYLKNWGRTDAVWVPGTSVDTAQFLTRWITHLCAPTFLFLVGCSLAISITRRVERGALPSSIDRHLAIRAFVVLALEACLSLAAFPGMWILQVLYAIGFSILATIVLRRLDSRVLVGLALAWFALGELVTTTLFPLDEVFVPVWGRMFFAPANAYPLMSIYPAVHWLAMSMLGLAFGRTLAPRRNGESASLASPCRKLVLWGIGGILVFAVVRGLNAYGNMGLMRDTGAGTATIVQWLHASKYPPSLSFIALELGLMALALAACFWLDAKRSGRSSDRNPVLVFGQTALFFYVLHFVVLQQSAEHLYGGEQRGGLLETWIVAPLCLAALYPVCLGYRALKRRWPRGPLQFV